MTVDYEIQSLWEWLLPSLGRTGALLEFTFMVAVICLIGVMAGYLCSALRHGFGEGFYRMAGVVVNSPRDIFRMGMGRILAMAMLAVQEAIRKKILIVFGIFVLFLLIAGWYLDQKNDRPAEIYLTFVLTATNFLIVLMSLFISAFSLPNDIKNRTIYTVVTKPVLASEIVVGRILGFTAVGTVMLALMGSVSYIFVVRGLSHQHDFVAENAEQEVAGGRVIGNGRTELANHHSHEFTFNDEEGIGETDSVMQHTHIVEKSGGEFAIAGPPQGMPPKGRVPSYGKLRFLNRAGAEGEGVNVGYEWTYRKYIEGGTLAAAIWTFDGINESNFSGDHLPLELNLTVFRTHKGDIKKSVVGEIILQNPDPAAAIRRSTPITFSVKEYETDQQLIPRKLSATRIDESTPIDVDLFDDLAPNGKLEVIVRCAERAQYFGMAQADVYFKASETWFVTNFFKAYAGIWMQMLIVICIGVTTSTCLSGPVAMMATISSVAMGVFARFIAGVFGEQWKSNPFLAKLFGTVLGKGAGIEGGGPIESFIRVVTQKNLSIDLEINPIVMAAITWIDLFLMGVLYIFTRILPDFRELNRADNVALGFDIPLTLLTQHGLITMSFFVMLSIGGYFILKTREIAA
jgi:hypothetical protein